MPARYTTASVRKYGISRVPLHGLVPLLVPHPSTGARISNNPGARLWSFRQGEIGPHTCSLPEGTCLTTAEPGKVAALQYEQARRLGGLAGAVMYPCAHQEEASPNQTCQKS